ncbi:Fructose-1,6-bisphosphatase [Carex littledalei]|uniref:Fructose-1,6-bisphosphatase n=1 Tax=Carex littledalei TaxID=544730 RepID=A0A833R0M8_9POAL|nr:Fructose-1,6-bisphosphatase [Carex littledalei]
MASEEDENPVWISDQAPFEDENSSATIFSASFGPGKGTHAFTLDQTIGEFILTHPDIKVPPREGLRQYIDTVRQGKGQSGKKYSARYICSLVADLHRTLLYGCIAMNPRDRLRLVYEANPLSFLVEEAGVRGFRW